MAKNDDFDEKVSIFWLKYNLFMVLLHTRRLLYKGIFILPFGPILNTVFEGAIMYLGLLGFFNKIFGVCFLFYYSYHMAGI